MTTTSANPCPLVRRIPSLLTCVARDERGSAGIELGIGAVVVLMIAALAFDLYSRVGADTGSARIAATMADYVSREVEPNGDEIAALGRYLHEHELKAPAALVYVISAVHQPPGDGPAETLWEDDTVRIGDDEATADLVQDCRERGRAAWRDAVLGKQEGSDGATEQEEVDDITLSANDVVIVVEVCAQLLRQGSLTSRFVSGTIYRLHALSARESETLPAAPVHTPGDDGAAGQTASHDPPPGRVTERDASAGWRRGAMTGVA